MRMRNLIVSGIAAALAIVGSSGCISRAEDSAGSSVGGALGPSVGVVTATEASLAIHLTSSLTSEDARVGDSWTGVLIDAVHVSDGDVIPAGSPVRGVVVAVRPGVTGEPAMIGLEMRSVCYLGKLRRLTAGAESVFAPAPENEGAPPNRVKLEPGRAMIFVTGAQPVAHTGG